MLLVFYYDFTTEFIGEIEIPNLEVGENYFVSISRNEFKPCFSCENDHVKFPFCLTNQPKANLV